MPLWDITAYSPRFGGTSSGPKYKWNKNSEWKLKTSRCLVWLTILPWRHLRYVPQKRHLTCNGLHGFIYQKTKLFQMYRCLLHTSVPTSRVILANVSSKVRLTACVVCGQSSWLQIQRSRFDSRRYQILWEVVFLERGFTQFREYNWGATWKKK
jgi:hypothetical protein